MLTNSSSFAGDDGNSVADLTTIGGDNDDEHNRDQIPAADSHNTRPPKNNENTRGKNENTAKTVALLNSGHKINRERNDRKAFKVKRTVYANKQKCFVDASNNLKKCYETIKRNRTNLPSSDCQSVEELEVTVKNIIEQVFDVKFPNTPSKEQFNHFVSDCVVPGPSLSLDTDDCCASGYRKLDSAIKNGFERVWKHVSDISEISAKYRVWLRYVIEPNEFCEFDVREYLIRNMFNEKERVERSQCELDGFHDYIQLTLMVIIDEVVDILTHKQCTTVGRHDNAVIDNKNNERREGESEENAGENVQTIIEERKRDINMKIKVLEMENEKLEKDECDCTWQTQIVLKELAFRNKNLENIKACIASLSKEKTDLISTIEKTEIEKEGLQTIQHQIETEREKNRHLRDFIAKQYEK